MMEDSVEAIHKPEPPTGTKHKRLGPRFPLPYADCPECCKPEPSIWSHLQNEHNFDIYMFKEICPACGLRFPDTFRRNRHRAEAHPAGFPVLSCTYCGFKAHSLTELEQHLANERSLPNRHLDLLECQLCSAYLTRPDFLSHVMCHLREYQRKIIQQQKKLARTSAKTKPNLTMKEAVPTMNRVGVFKTLPPPGQVMPSSPVTSLPTSCGIVREPFPTKDSPLHECQIYYFDLKLTDCTVVASQYGTSLEWIFDPPPVSPAKEAII